MSKRRSIPTKLINEVRELNKKLSKKKSNIKQRHGFEIDIARIDVNAPAGERRKQINEVKRFLNPNNQNFQYVKNQHGVSFPKAEVNKAKRLNDRANRIKKREQKRIGNMDFILEGKVLGKVKDVKTAQHLLNEFTPLKFDINMFRSLEGFRKNLEQKIDRYEGDFITRQRESYKDNYIRALKDVFGDSSELRPLIQHIRSMNTHQFFIETQVYDNREIKDIYDEIDRDAKLEGLMSAWGLSNHNYNTLRLDPTDLQKDSDFKNKRKNRS